ncbi:MAG TPA: hypothetical protein DCR20_11845 [Planctomycetaceae bacterium]|nr:hypothetical protein [Planctomycetaceae bacterium]
MLRSLSWLLVCGCVAVSAVADEPAGDKSAALTGQGPATAAAETADFFKRPAVQSEARVSVVRQGDAEIPLVVVKGTPYEMGRQLGQALKQQITTFLPAALPAICKELGLTEEQLQEVWSRSSAYSDDRLEQELAGVADGTGLPLRTLQAMHAVPLLMPYSCSSIAAWGEATEDGHLYQTRNLDWNLELGAHNFAAIVIYVPDVGSPHVVPTFAGFSGAHTGMNFHGIALSEMGDASGKEAPYFVHAPHFTAFFRTMLYDADSLTEALEIFRQQPMTKRYHFVFGDGRTDRRAVKVRAHSPEPADRRLMIWKDNDATDEFAPNVLSCVVYNDEGRGAFPTLKSGHGKLNGEALVKLANQIPIKGGNVINVVYDATDLKMWVTYAHGSEEAYQRPSVLIDLRQVVGPDVSATRTAAP